MRVLVADDSAVARLTLARALRAEGLDVDERASVAEASTVVPDDVACAVLDLELDDGDGTTIAARLRASSPQMPIAFFSSALPTSALASRAASFGPVFAKPTELAAAVAWARRATRR